MKNKGKIVAVIKHHIMGALDSEWLD